MITDKVRPHHLERKALLYVRQSSAHQVLHNRESSALQYAMRDRLMALGWSEIEVIDDDLGRSAAGGVQREFVRADVPGADSIADGPHRAGRQFELLHRRIEPLEPIGVIEPQLDRERLVEIIVNHRRGGHFIATRDRHRQIEIDKERLEYAER